MAAIWNLPSELLLDIFSRYIRSEGHEEFSKNIPRVCKYWNDLSKTDSLWKNVKIREPKYLMNIAQRELLKSTQSLEFHHRITFGISKINFSEVFKNITDLKYLEFADNVVGREAIIALTENCPHLEHLNVRFVESFRSRSRDFRQFYTICGQTLKYLHLTTSCTMKRCRKLVLGIAANCTVLETLVFNPKEEGSPFPIHELRSGCQRLKELEFRNCLITDEGNDYLGSGFEELKKFRARSCNFSGIDIYSLLKDSTNLEHLKLCCNDDLPFQNISGIPSDRVRFLIIGLKDPVEDLIPEALKDAMWKWRRTLSVLYLDGWRCDVNNILKLLLDDNPNPQLKSLTISGDIDPYFFEEFVQQCQKLIRLQINWYRYFGREKIKEALESLKKTE